MTSSELMEAFPEALPMIKRNVALYRKALKELEPVHSELLDSLLVLVYLKEDGTDEDRERGTDFMHRRFYDKPIGVIERHLKRLERLKDLYEHKDDPVPEGKITDRDIANAKERYMGEYIEILPGDKLRCIFHDDRKPSAKYYPDKNTMYCFVCNKKWDTVDVIMRLRNCKFLDAVKFILKK